MKTNEAIIKLSKGKKMRRKHWYNKYYIFFDLYGNKIKDVYGNDFVFKPSTLKANDWEEFKEKELIYKCGHGVNAIILDDNILSLTAYEEWKNSVGFLGDKSMCFDCWCEEEFKTLNDIYEKEIRDGSIDRVLGQTFLKNKIRAEAIRLVKKKRYKIEEEDWMDFFNITEENLK